MNKDNVFTLKKPESIIVDQITNCRQGVRKVSAHALGAGIDHFICQHEGLRDPVASMKTMAFLNKVCMDCHQQVNVSRNCFGSNMENSLQKAS
jgi:hypothetical protein